MKTNVAACTSIGSYFYPQIGKIYMDMLNMYRASSGLIDDAVKREGLIATKMPKVRGLRTIKKEILKLINTYVEKADDLQMVHQNLVPGLLEAVLADYQRNVPDAREPEVLNMMTTIITKLHVRWSPKRSPYMVQLLLPSSLYHMLTLTQSIMEDQVPVIMENVFECTLEMINKDFSEYPEHRVQFFNLLRAINLYCFNALVRLDARQFKFVIDSCLWASKHDNREVEAAGLQMCIELMDNMSNTDATTCSTFFQNFYTNILQDVFFVLTDSDHKAGFKYQSMLLAKMIYLVDSGKLQAPVYNTSETPAGTSNRAFLEGYIQNLLTTAFSNLQPAQIQNFVKSMFECNSDLNRFKLTLRDFLISLREFSSGDNAELYAEEKEQEAEKAKAEERERAGKVGGLIKPSDMDDDEL